MEIPGFEIKRVIGKGGMATAYLAIQRSPNRLVALKALGLWASAGWMEEDRASLVERFLNEGAIVSGLRHPNIIEVYGIGECDDCLYIYMEYVGGGDLARRIARGMTPDAALDIVTDIGGALGHAHARGVIHRDVKPNNILFRRDGTPLLSDFGIAKQLNLDSEITAVGMLLGSPLYMSPEQAEGKTLDGRSDIYSLGVVLHEMLTGRPPFVATSPLQIILKHAQEPIPALPRRLRRFQPLLEGMLAKERDERLPDAGAATEMARSLHAGAASEAPPPAGSEAIEASAPRDDPTVETRVTHIITRVQAGILADLEADRLELPTIPEVVTRVRRVLEDPDATGEAVARAVAVDAALAAQVLRIANSAMYTARAPVGDLRQAVVRLGGKGVEQIVTLLAVAQIFNLKASRRLKAMLGEVWRQSTRVAAISETLARRLPGLEPGVAMLGGLLHNIGAVPVLAWAERIPGLLEDEESVRQVITRVHIDLGRAILTSWKFPPELVEMVAGHGETSRDRRPGPDYVDVVVVARRLSLPTGPDGIALPPGPATEKLGLTPATAEQVLAEAETKMEELGRLFAT